MGGHSLNVDERNPPRISSSVLQGYKTNSVFLYSSLLHVLKMPERAKSKCPNGRNIALFYFQMQEQVGKFVDVTV